MGKVRATRNTDDSRAGNKDSGVRGDRSCRGLREVKRRWRGAGAEGRRCPRKPPPDSPREAWSGLRDTGQLTDAVIESSDGVVKRVHKIVLAMESDYFRALFTGPWAGSGPGFKIDCPADVLEAIIDFAYKGTCRVDKENVESLLPAADRLGFLGLVESCSEYLGSQLSESNCIGLYRFASAYSLRPLAGAAFELALARFEALAARRAPAAQPAADEFLGLDPHELASLASDDRANVTGEDVVFQGIDRWIRHDLPRREKFAHLLFQSIRFGLMRLHFFRTQVLTAPYLSCVSPSFLDDVRAKMERKAREEELLYVSSDPLSRPRIPHEVLFAIGGWSNVCASATVETYDIRSDKWFTCGPDLKSARAYHGVATMDNLLYVVGGYDGQTHYNTLLCFDPAKRRWTEKSCMHVARCYVAVVALEGSIFAMGGFNGQARLDSAERYNAAANQWEMIAPMTRVRSDAGAAAFKNKIIVAGGYNGEEVLDSAEIYSLETGTWTLVAWMNSPRSGVSLVNHGGFVYALGGFNGFGRLASVERYDTNRAGNSTWDWNLPPMLYERSNFACTIMDSAIFVIGGFNGNTTMSQTEYLDPYSNQWVEAWSMKRGRSALAVGLCSGLPNALEFTFNSHHPRTGEEGRPERTRPTRTSPTRRH